MCGVCGEDEGVAKALGMQSADGVAISRTTASAYYKHTIGFAPGVTTAGSSWDKRAGLGRRSHLGLKPRLNLELKGVELLLVERRRQGYDEW